jgi:actin-related protein 5
MGHSTTNENLSSSGGNSPKPPPAKLWSVNDPPFEGFRLIDTEGYQRSSPNTAIVIDNGIQPSPVSIIEEASLQIY